MPYLQELEFGKNLWEAVRIIAGSTSKPKKVLSLWKEWEKDVVECDSETSFSEFMDLSGTWLEKDRPFFSYMESIRDVAIRLYEVQQEKEKADALIRSMTESLDAMWEHSENLKMG